MLPAFQSVAVLVCAVLVTVSTTVSCASSDEGGQFVASDPATPHLAVEGFTIAEPGVALSGRPDDEEFRAAQEAGYATVVNLLTVDEGAAGEALLVSVLGMRHVHVPIAGPNVTPASADELAGVLDSGDGRPVLIHCASGQRAAGVYALYLVRHRDVELHDALDRAAELGLTKAAVRDAVHRAGHPVAE